MEKKRFLALLLVLTTVFSVSLSAQAAVRYDSDNAALYSDREEEIIEQNERSAQDFRRKTNTFQERNGEIVGGHQDVSASRSFGRKQERDGVTQYRLYLFRHRQGRSEASFH